MSKRTNITSLKDQFKYAAHGLAAAGTVVCSYALSEPWTIAVAGGITAVALVHKRRSQNFIENELEAHPDVHHFSPNLQTMVDKLSAISGIEEEDVYNFKPKPKPANENDKNEGVRGAFRKMQDSHNAAASDFTKPVVMISEPLLELLDDNEEYAVLAHEFAHVLGRHQKKAHYLNIPMGIARGSNTLVLASSVIGNVGEVAKATVMATPAGIVAGSWMSSKPAKWGVGIAAGTAVAAYASPELMTYVLGCTILNASTTLIGQSLSRTNEYHADRGAVKLGACPLALITSLRKINAVHQASTNKADDENATDKKEPSQFKKMAEELLSTHPELNKRIHALGQIAYDMVHENGEPVYSDLEMYNAIKGDLDMIDTKHISIEDITFTVSRLHLDSDVRSLNPFTLESPFQQRHG